MKNSREVIYRKNLGVVIEMTEHPPILVPENLSPKKTNWKSCLFIAGVIIALMGVFMLFSPTANEVKQERPLKEVFENGKIEIEVGEDTSEFSLERVGDGILIRGNREVQVYYEQEEGKCTKYTISGDFLAEKAFPCDRKIRKIVV